MSIAINKSNGKNAQVVLESLKDTKIWKVGIYGMGGSGKTSAITEIIHQIHNTGAFDTVILVDVLYELDLHQVQDQIAQKVDLDLSSCVDQEGRAAQLLKRLNQPNKKFLIIFEDVWEQISLEKVGIPQHKKGNRCKVVITTPFLRVCLDMGMHKSIRMEPLPYKEALELLVFDVPNRLLTPECQTLAEELVRECDGLPLAIQKIGVAMKKKVDAKSWEKLLVNLRISPRIIRGMGHVFYNFVVSYSNLRNDEVRKFFLHLALFPKTFKVEASELIWYWVAQLLNEEIRSTMDIDEVSCIINELVDAGLLVKCSELGNDHMRMHNLARELAIKILQEDGGTGEDGGILIKAGLGLTEPPNRHEWQESRKMSLMNNMIQVLPNKPKCPKLTTLFLRQNPLSKNISFSFFNKMPALEILDLSHTNISHLPSSLSELLTLQALFLQECSSLVKIPSLAKLKKLRLLNLSHAGIKELPQGMEELISLSFLDLSFTNDLEMESLTIQEPRKFSMKKNQSNVLCDQPNLSNLLSLSLQGNHRFQKVCSTFFNHTPALEILNLSQTSISELPSSLSDLLNLRVLCLQECTLLEKIPSLRKLKKLHMLNLSHTIIKNLPQGVDELTSLTSLDCSFTYQLESCVISELTLLEELYMDGSKIWMTDPVSFFNSIEEMRSFNHLAVLTLSFVNLENYVKAFRRMRWRRLQNFGIRLSDAMNLSVLYHTKFGPKFVYIHNQKICSYPITLPLPPNTEELQLSLCDIPRLSELFCLRYLRFLNKCHIERCFLMSGDCLILGDEMEEQSLGSLQNLSVENVRGLAALCKGVVKNPILTNLRVLDVHSCGHLKIIFEFSFLHHLKNIEVIKITLCRLLEEIASALQRPDDIGSTTIILPMLRILILRDLPKLHTISRTTWVCPSLCNVEVLRCQRLKKLHFSVDGLSNLENIQGEKEWWEALEWDNANTKLLLESRFQQTEHIY